MSAETGSPASEGPLVGLLAVMERLSVSMACVSGALLTLLSFFIAADVLGRGYGGFYSGATDEIAGFSMTLAVTWALAYRSRSTSTCVSTCCSPPFLRACGGCSIGSH